MRRCIELCARSQGNHQPNPEVGALLVYQQQIIGEGFHRKYGGAHAEVEAVASVLPEHRALIPQSTLYVTLEPCFHHGKTPPCVDLVLRERIQRVVVGMQDCFPLVAGQSIAKLRAAGVEVKVGVLEAEIAWLNRRFICTVQKARPYVVLKYAQSKNGLIALPNTRTAISNALTQRLVHKWRSEEQAILIGSNTFRIDNPLLNNRLYTGRSPQKIVLDRHPNQNTYPEDFLVLSEPNIPAVLAKMQTLKIQSVLVEGGQKILQAFITAGLWDEARVLTGKDCLDTGIPAPLLTQSHLRESAQIADNQLQIFTNTNPSTL
jgi:diaminohydroxyphosphoribosylaminopyrimidine deaminase/5-amino-6-(5-phosphoribosylamino)uracil reductase